MNTSRTLDAILVGTAITLGAYLFTTGERPTQAEMEARRNNLLPAFLPAEIERIVVTDPTGPILELRADPSEEFGRGYFLGAEGKRNAEESAVDEYISALEFSTWERTLDDQGAPLDEFGFRDPILEVRVEAGPRTYRLLFGKKAPHPPGSVYARIEGANIPTTVGVVSGEVVEKLHRSEQEFQSALVLPYSKRQTSRLVLDGDRGRAILIADELGFSLENEGTQTIRADRTFTDIVFFQLARAKFEHYLGPEAKPPEGSHPQVTVVQDSPFGPTYRAVFGGPCPDQEGLVLAERTLPHAARGCVPQTVMAALLLPRDRFIDSTAVPLRADEIDHVTVRLNDELLDVIRDDADFRLLSGDSQVIPHEAGSEFFEAIAEAQLRPIDKPESLPKAVGELIVKGQSPLTAASPKDPPLPPLAAATEASDPALDGARQLELTIHRVDEALVLQRLDDGVFLEVPDESAWAFRADDAWARDRNLSDFSATDVMEVRIEFPGDMAVGAVRSAEGFSLLAPATGRADPLLTRALFDEVAHIEAKRFLSPSKPRPAAGLLVVHFRVQRKSEKAPIDETLWIGERTQGGYLAWSTLADGAFVLPRHSRMVYETPLIDRSSVEIEPDELKRITVTRGDQTYSFERHGGVLRMSGGNARDEMVTSFEEALRHIAVVTAVPKRDEADWIRLKKAQLTLEGATTAGADTGSFVLFVGLPGVWQGKSVRVVWKKGDEQMYLIDNSSLEELLDLL